MLPCIPSVTPMTPLRVQIRQLRESQGLTQAALAEKSGVSRVTIARIEGGRQLRVDLEVLDRLARALGVAPGLLIAEDGAPPKRRK